MQVQRRKSFKSNRIFDVDLLFQNRQRQNVEIRRQLRQDMISKNRNLSSHSEYIESIEPKLFVRNLKIENLSEMVQGIYSNNIEKQLISMKKFRKLLAEERVPPIQQIIDAGVIPKFVEFLQSKNQLLKIESSWALTNILAGKIEHIKVVIDSGALPIFVQLLQNENSTDEIKEHAIWAIGNISSDEMFCEMVFCSGALKCLLNILNQLDENSSLIPTLSRTICNLCRFKVSEKDWYWLAPALIALSRMIYSNDDDVLYSTCWALSYLSDCEIDCIQRKQAIINTGICPRLVELMIHKNFNVQIPALKCVKNISSGSYDQTQVILHCEALKNLKDLLVSTKNSIRKEACLIVSTIATRADNQIQSIVDSGIIPLLIDLIRNSDFKTKREAIWAICNAIRHSYGQPNSFRQIINLGCIQPMIDMLDCTDFEVILTVLESIQIILKFGESAKTPNNRENEYSLLIEEIGGKEKIHDLQYHDKNEIYHIAYNIIDKYFCEECEEGYEEKNNEYNNNSNNNFDNEEKSNSNHNHFLIQHTAGFQFLKYPNNGGFQQIGQNGYFLPSETNQSSNNHKKNNNGFIFPNQFAGF